MSGQPSDAARRQALVGTWRRVPTEGRAAMGAPYPDTLTFDPRGFYTGRKGPTGADFTTWDAGSFEVVAPDKLRLSTATDAVITYGYDIDGETLTVYDDAGRAVRYARAPDTT